MYVLCRQAGPETAIYRVVMGDAYERTTQLELTRRIEYLLQVIAAGMQLDLGPLGPRIQPMPWDEPDNTRPDAMSLEEVYAFMGQEMPAELMN